MKSGGRLSRSRRPLDHEHIVNRSTHEAALVRTDRLDDLPHARAPTKSERVEEEVVEAGQFLGRLAGIEVCRYSGRLASIKALLHDAQEDVAGRREGPTRGKTHRLIHACFVVANGSVDAPVDKHRVMSSALDAKLSDVDGLVSEGVDSADDQTDVITQAIEFTVRQAPHEFRRHGIAGCARRDTPLRTFSHRLQAGINELNPLLLARHVCVGAHARGVRLSDSFSGCEPADSTMPSRILGPNKPPAMYPDGWSVHAGFSPTNPRLNNLHPIARGDTSSLAATSAARSTW